MFDARSWRKKPRKRPANPYRAWTCKATLGVVATVGLLALPAMAWGGETAPGSTETLTLKAPNEREVGKPMMITV
jgi:hypothetical protein